MGGPGSGPRKRGGSKGGKTFVPSKTVRAHLGSKVFYNSPKFKAALRKQKRRGW